MNRVFLLDFNSVQRVPRRHLSTGSCVDPFTQDQLVVFMALAAGRSEVRIGVEPYEGSGLRRDHGR